MYQGPGYGRTPSYNSQDIVVLFFLPQLLPILPGSLRQRVCNPSLDICESLCHIQNDKHIVLEDGRDLCVAVSPSPELRLLAMLKPEVDGRHTWDELVEAGLLPWKLQPLQIIATLWRTLQVLKTPRCPGLACYPLTGSSIEMVWMHGSFRDVFVPVPFPTDVSSMVSC